MLGYAPRPVRRRPLRWYAVQMLASAVVIGLVAALVTAQSATGGVSEAGPHVVTSSTAAVKYIDQAPDSLPAPDAPDPRVGRWRLVARRACISVSVASGNPRISSSKSL